jgi:hypothetical protein
MAQAKVALAEVSKTAATPMNEYTAVTKGVDSL